MEALLVTARNQRVAPKNRYCNGRCWNSEIKIHGETSMNKINSSLEYKVDDLLKEAKEDYVGLWEISQITREAFGGGNEARESSLIIVRQLHTKGLKAGNLTQDGSFALWPDQDANAVVDRIAREWLEPDADSAIYDTAWFWLPR
jgi:hypothetical protein